MQKISTSAVTTSKKIIKSSFEHCHNQFLKIFAKHMWDKRSHALPWHIRCSFTSAASWKPYMRIRLTGLD
jgi:hypothetical protein